MGLDHAQSPPVLSPKIPDEPEPSIVDEPHTEQVGLDVNGGSPAFGRWLIVGFSLLAVAMLVLMGVVVVYKDRLADEICRRGVDVPGLSCSKKDKDKDKDDDEDRDKDDEDRDKDDDDEDKDNKGDGGDESDEADPERTEPDLAEVGASVGEPSDATGIVFSFPHHQEEQIEKVKLDCTGHESVKQTWWASVEATELGECKLQVFPSYERETFTDLHEGHYVCSASPEISCEREE
jgi:hypothetical protein